MKCIICWKDGVEFSKEHVIPESLGGFYVIDTVCKKCNSDLGQHVDSKIINEFAPKLYRLKHQLKGKSGKLPVVFSSKYKNLLNEKGEYKLVTNDDGKIEPVLVQSVKMDASGNAGHYNVTSSFDEIEENIEDKTLEIIDKKIKRQGYTDFDITSSSITKVNTPITLSVNVEVSSSDSFISILKMAYEFAISNVPLYIDDEQAMDISTILKESNYEAARNYVKGHNTFVSPDISPIFKKIFNLDENIHFMLLHDFDGCLSCIVMLKEIGNYPVKLSNKSYGHSIVLINDVSNAKCEISTMYQYIEKYFKN